MCNPSLSLEPTSANNYFQMMPNCQNKTFVLLCILNITTSTYHHHIIMRCFRCLQMRGSYKAHPKTPRGNQPQFRWLPGVSARRNLPSFRILDLQWFFQVQMGMNQTWLQMDRPRRPHFCREVGRSSNCQPWCFSWFDSGKSSTNYLILPPTFPKCVLETAIMARQKQCWKSSSSRQAYPLPENYTG